MIDAHGQPCNRAFNAARITDREIDELIGTCKGILADGKVNQQEAEYLQKWLRANKEAASKWPCKVIAARIRDYLSDGFLDAEEAADLFDLLKRFTGGDLVEGCEINMSTGLAFDRPCPKIKFQDRLFCLTGRFAYGTRKDCEREIVKLGGLVKSNPIQKTNYLIIGCVGSTDWIHSSHGRKIEKAIELRENGFPITVIPEDHWVECLI